MAILSEKHRELQLGSLILHFSPSIFRKEQIILIFVSQLKNQNDEHDYRIPRIDIDQLIHPLGAE